MDKKSCFEMVAVLEFAAAQIEKRVRTEIELGKSKRELMDAKLENKRLKQEIKNG